MTAGAWQPIIVQPTHMQHGHRQVHGRLGIRRVKSAIFGWMPVLEQMNVKRAFDLCDRRVDV